VIDASYTVSPNDTSKTAAVASENPPFEVAQDKPSPPAAEADPLKPDTTMALVEIEILVKEVGMTVAQLEERLRASNPAFRSIADLPEDKANLLLDNLRKQVEAAKGKSKGN
jgi:hypothetical protein